MLLLLINNIKFQQNNTINDKMSAQNSRNDSLNVTNNFDKRISVTAADTRTGHNLFTPQQIQNIKLNNLRQRRRQLQDKLKLVANRINFKRKKEEQQLKKFIRSEQKSIALMETHNYKKYNDMLKQELDQRKTFQIRKKAKEVQDVRVSSNRRVSLIYQAIKDKKTEQSERIRRLKKMDEESLKQSKQVAYNIRKQQHQSVNKMKERQNLKKRCYWFEKRLSFQQKILEDAQIYEKQVEDYYKKIEDLKENEEKLKKQEQQAAQVLKCAQQNYQLLKQS